MSSSATGEDVGVRTKPKYRPPRKNKKNPSTGSHEAGTGGSESSSQSHVKHGVDERSESVLAAPHRTGAGRGNGARIVSAKLSMAQSSWQDHWTACDYSKNEVKTKHRQLIVLDLNGTLIKRGAKNSDRSRTGYARPHLANFLQFILNNFAVMVWSSAQPFSVNNMLQVFMNEQQKRFVRVWDRRFCDIDGNYFGKAQTTKDLLKITSGYSLADSPHRNVYDTYRGYLGVAPEMKDHWTLENIVLVDDSETKAVRQKENHVHVSSFEDLRHDDELLKLHLYLTKYVDSKDIYPNLVDYLKEHPWPEFRDCISSKPPSASEQ